MAEQKRMLLALAGWLSLGLVWQSASADPPTDDTVQAAQKNSGLLELPLPPGGVPPAPSPAPAISPPASANPAAPASQPAPNVPLAGSLPSAPATTPAAKPAAAAAVPPALTAPVSPAQSPGATQPYAVVPQAPLPLGKPDLPFRVAPPSGAPDGASAGAAAAATPGAAAASRSAQDVSAKNPDILLEPTHIGQTSVMFSNSDMSLINQALDVYDASRTQNAESLANRDDLSSLLDSLKTKKEAGAGGAAEENAPLPNLYLGSIVYYSPGSWSVWINGRKLVNKNNSPAGEFYVDRLSRSEVELVWKPATLQDIPSHWQQMTENGIHPLDRIQVDSSKGTVMLDLRPNQTFLPRSLTIREGLIRTPKPVTPPGAQSAAAAPMGQAGGFAPPNARMMLDKFMRQNTNSPPSNFPGNPR